MRQVVIATRPTKDAQSDSGSLPSQRRAAVQRAGLFGALCVLAASAAAGGVLVAVHQLSPHPSTYAGPPLTGGAGPFAIGQAFRAEGAVVKVTAVDQLSGLSPQDLSSANHGIQNLVAPKDAQVQLTLNIVNYGTGAVTISTAHIGLRIAGKAAIKPISSTLSKGRLGAGLSLEGEFGFVAPRNGSTLQLEIPGAHGPVLVDLGRTEKSTTHDSGGHHH